MPGQSPLNRFRARLADARLNERGRTLAETHYWYRQWRMLANDAIDELERRAAQSTARQRKSRRTPVHPSVRPKG